jgi:hypothetical protein
MGFGFDAVGAQGLERPATGGRQPSHGLSKKRGLKRVFSGIFSRVVV